MTRRAENTGAEYRRENRDEREKIAAHSMTLRERGPCQRNTHSPHWARHTAGRPGAASVRRGTAQAGAARARARPSRASRRERGPCQRNTHSPHWARHTAGRPGAASVRRGTAQAGAARARARPSRASRRPANGAGAWNSSTRHRASPPRRAPAATRVRGRPIVGHNQLVGLGARMSW